MFENVTLVFFFLLLSFGLMYLVSFVLWVWMLADCLKSQKWYFWATHSRLNPITETAKTVKKHWDGVLNYFDSKITNGILERINSLVQLQKRNARGFKNVQYFINMIYLKLGKLKFELPT